MNTQVLFKIANVELKQFAYEFENYNEEEAVDVSVQIGFMIDEPTFTLSCAIKFKYEQNGLFLLKSEIVTHFQIEQQTFETFSNGNEWIISKDLLRHLATLVVGTSRGIIWAKTEGTCLNKVVLPTINLVDIIQVDLKATKQSKQ